MGTWEAGNFDNDDAMDWVNEFTDAPSERFIQATLQAVTQLGDEYLEAPESSMALAAAEVVAALKGAPHAQLPEELQEFAKRTRIKADQQLVDLALAAIERIRTSSELKDLWQENETPSPKWLAAVTDLEERLKQPL
ncbi:MAG: DUF4259 domain-containing protein [Abitibacteriaceae bacterium]|nr:DUF4259 domain-containing protein [Abditibacteriaceae bacterium]MBV9865828.1 DUF4259 domain-containing protein [Abditibacteriaceae bacterium]